MNLNQARNYWDQEAADFDNEPDHGLRTPSLRAAWGRLLQEALPAPPAAVLDIGCGTGSLSILLAERGYRVSGLDLSLAMLGCARAKAQNAGQAVTFLAGDAFEPPLAPRRFDAIVCRHLLWALPEPAPALARWAALLVEHGRLLLIEGYWHTGGGLHAQQTLTALPPSLNRVSTQDLSARPELWGKPVNDERYLVVARPAT